MWKTKLTEKVRHVREDHMEQALNLYLKQQD